MGSAGPPVGSDQREELVDGLGPVLHHVVAAVVADPLVVEGDERKGLGKDAARAAAERRNPRGVVLEDGRLLRGAWQAGNPRRVEDEGLLRPPVGDVPGRAMKTRCRGTGRGALPATVGEGEPLDAERIQVEHQAVAGGHGGDLERPPLLEPHRPGHLLEEPALGCEGQQPGVVDQRVERPVVGGERHGVPVVEQEGGRHRAHDLLDRPGHRPGYVPAVPEVLADQREHDLGVDVGGPPEPGVRRPELPLVDDDPVVDAHHPVLEDGLVVHVVEVGTVGDEPGVAHGGERCRPGHGVTQEPPGLRRPEEVADGHRALQDPELALRLAAQDQPRGVGPARLREEGDRAQRVLRKGPAQAGVRPDEDSKDAAHAPLPPIAYLLRTPRNTMSEKVCHRYRASVRSGRSQ